jgi:succinylglutamate desuccinylase
MEPISVGVLGVRLRWLARGVVVLVRRIVEYTALLVSMSRCIPS